jgi:hypothetical protein
MTDIHIGMNLLDIHDIHGHLKAGKTYPCFLDRGHITVNQVVTLDIPHYTGISHYQNLIETLVEEAQQKRFAYVNKYLTTVGLDTFEEEWVAMYIWDHSEFGVVQFTHSTSDES